MNCWNCGDNLILCKFRHFVKDVVVPLLVGLAVGSVIGKLAALFQNWWVNQ